MIRLLKIIIVLVFMINISCKNKEHNLDKRPEEILGNPYYKAICYGGYRFNSRTQTPTKHQVKEDLKILAALGFKVIRTYNVHLPEIDVILESIKELQKEDHSFEMYVMLGAWIDCKNAWTSEPPIHHLESDRNEVEIKKAIELANKYSDIIKIIAVGNEAMVTWATSYYVTSDIILKWVNFLQNEKKKGNLSKYIWITSSDNFASWGGGENSYKTNTLQKLIEAVDYISIHTYPMHDTHYNPEFWGISSDDTLGYNKEQQVALLMKKATNYAIKQYTNVKEYCKSLGLNKPIHIGETGWATKSNEFYGNSGSKATDEYKQALYYKMINTWCEKEKISCFFFEAFDESWKDAQNPEGSENHFGLINLKNEVKFALWQDFDKGVFEKLKRDDKPLSKTYNGKKESLLNEVYIPIIDSVLHD